MPILYDIGIFSVEGSDGSVGAGWKLNFYTSGTSSRRNTYPTSADASAGTNPNANPVVADANGRFAPIWLVDTDYKAILTDAADVVKVTRDPAVSQTTNVGPIYVADYGTLDPTGATDNTAIFQAAYTAANAANRTLQLPAGTFKTTGLTWNEDGPEVRGWGPTNTVFTPAANSQAYVIKLERSSTVNRRQKRVFASFSIDLTGYTGCIGLQTWWLVGSDVSNIGINGGESSPYNSLNIGWHSEADQYSSFADIAIERCAYPFRMRPDTVTSQGGGLNNNYTNVFFAQCRVGMDIVNTDTLPMGNLDFINAKVQNYTECAIYTYNVQKVYISGMTPENGTEAAPAATVVVDGNTIKTGTIHCDYRSQVHFESYDHVSNQTYRKIWATNSSNIKFENSGGAAPRTDADSTSTIQWHGSSGNTGRFINTIMDLQDADFAREAYGWHYATVTEDKSFPNEVPTPYKGGTVTARAGATYTLDTTEDIGPVMTFVYGAAAGVYQVSNSVIMVYGGGTSMPADAFMFSSVLVKSSVAGEYSFYHSNTVQNIRFTLPANEWVRVWMTARQGAAATNAALEIFPTFATGATLQVMKPALIINETALNYRKFSQTHIYNPHDAKGHVLRSEAAPATGTHVVGAEAWDPTPAAAGVPGWVCVTAGTPGTWKAMAALAP